MRKLIQLSGDRAIDLLDNKVLPTDIQFVICNDEELSLLFKYNNELPIVVTINTQRFTHMFTEEFMCGLLFFSAAAQTNFHITIFDAPLPSEYIVPENRNRYAGGIPRAYAVEVLGIIYQFDTTDFIQQRATI